MSSRNDVTRDLQWDEERDEPFLESPLFPGLRITPTRAGDEANLAQLYAHEVIGKRFYRIPFPCPPEEIHRLIEEALKTEHTPIKALRALRKSSSSLTERHLIPGYPFRWLREPSGRIIGEFSFEPDPPNDMAEEEMLALPPHQQEWGLGYALDPSYHGRGIASELVGLVLSWVEKWMDIGKITAGHEGDNPASRRILTKLGFTLLRVKVVDWPDGGRREMWSYEKKLNSETKALRETSLT